MYTSKRSTQRAAYMKEKLNTVRVNDEHYAKIIEWANLYAENNKSRALREMIAYADKKKREELK